MSRYGEALEGEKLSAQFDARERAQYSCEFHPELWKSTDIAPFYDGRVWTRVKFTSPTPAEVPTESGIYMFVVAPHCGGLHDHSYIFYVGKATNLKERYGDYLEEKACLGHSPRPKVYKFLNHLEEFIFFDYTLVPKNELDRAEALLKNNLTPFANTQVDVIGRLTP